MSCWPLIPHLLTYFLQPPQDYDSRRANAYSVPPHMVSSSTAAYDRPPYEPRRHSRERPERHVRAPVKPEPRRQQDDGYKPRPPRPISPPPPEKVYEPLEADMEIDRVWDTGSPPSSERGRTSAHPHSPTRGRGHGFVHPLPPKPSHTAFTELPTGADDQGRRGRRNSPLGKITRAVFPAGLLEEEILEIQRSVGLAPGSPVAVRQRAPEQLGDVDMGPLHVDERRVWQDRDRGQREWGREKEWERERLPPPRRERSPHSRGSLLERMNGLVGNPGPNEVEDDRQPPVVSSNTLRDRVSVPSKRDHDEVGHSGAESCGPPDGELPKRRRRARDAKSKKGHVRR
ncbi:hypothetical protein FA15DRAFT_41534 [Coprinopsis marcescibilis]|uniref:Uncharacterized protein n=1 Tax=Coprinopsis marcescibilis TaxID=230819 RepID=A0A5C3L6Y9_COPMA|nr:hypothetical protein FA15DRAFT_41534 [Coprinopsis marcescibilis]